MKNFFGAIFSLAIVLIPAYSSLSLMLFLWDMTLIDSKFPLSIGSIGMILFPILMKDLAYMFAEWQWEKYGDTFNKGTHRLSEGETIDQNYHALLFFFLPAIGFGLFLSTFLYFNLNLPTQNITEKIQTPILEVRTTYNSRKYGGSGQADGKKATVVIKGYSKDIKFPLESEIQEGQLLSFSVRKGYFGFDVIEKL